MAKEIERKFLIDQTKLGNLEDGAYIKQGYISTTDKTVVRVRVVSEKAYLTLKGENKGVVRTEFEYSIPHKDANEMISELCNGPIIEKTRYLLNYCEHTWEVDIFHGQNHGLVIAEIELTTENEKFELPPWLGEEVSGDAKYYNSNLLENPFNKWN